MEVRGENMGKKIYLDSVICHKHQTLKEWQEENPVLEDGEVSFVNDGKNGNWVKVGDGETSWNDLPYNMGAGTEGDNGNVNVDQTYNPESENAQSGKAVAEAMNTVGEKWVELVNVTLTENLATEFRQVFDKAYRKIRFKIIFFGSNQTTLSNVRFKRAKADGNENYAAHNYLLYNSGGNLATRRIVWGTAYFDLDNRICVKDGGTTTGYRVFSGDGDTFGSDMLFQAEQQNFPEFYFYLGGSIAEDGTLSGNVIGNGTTIQVWGCE